jgi:hypothetical protein
MNAEGDDDKFGVLSVAFLPLLLLCRVVRPAKLPGPRPPGPEPPVFLGILLWVTILFINMSLTTSYLKSLLPLYEK